MPVNVHKKRVTLMLQEKLHLSKVENKPEELKQLMAGYQEFCKHLNHLLELLKVQQSKMAKYNESRVKVVRHLAMMSVDTPVHGLIGNDEGKSFKAIHNELKVSVNRAEEQFAADTVDKVVEWEQTIVYRVKHMQKYCDGLRRDLAHYEKKVDKMHSSIKNSEQNGKPVNTPMYEKRDRNDEKLEMAREEYQKNARELEMYLVQVTENGWRDLVPLVHRLATWDVKSADDQAGILAGLKDVLGGLEQVAETSGFNAAADRVGALKGEAVENLMKPEISAYPVPNTPPPPPKPTVPTTPETSASPDSTAAAEDYDAPTSPQSSTRSADPPSTAEVNTPPQSPERTTPDERPSTPKETKTSDPDINVDADSDDGIYDDDGRKAEI